MLIPILVALAVLVVVVVALVLTRPPRFSVSRSLAIPADPDALYALVADFRNWPRWNPWDKVDPAMRRELSQHPVGVGAEYHYLGDKRVGEGRITITEAVPAQRVVLDLNFLKPFAARNRGEFTFVPGADGTVVTWSMSGESKGFFCKLMGLVMNMDRMIGGQFEKGLQAMRDDVAGQATAAR